jgi:hypothetical protein
MLNTIRWGLVAAAIVSSLPAAAAGKKAAGIITNFECGDNCYLTIKTEGGREITALCAARNCAAWNEQAEMPEKFMGRQVQVTIGVGEQYDGAGNLMGDFPAFTRMVVGKKRGG